MARYSYNDMGKTFLGYLLGHKKYITATQYRGAVPQTFDDFLVKNCCPATNDPHVELAYRSLSKEGETTNSIAQQVKFILEEKKPDHFTNPNYAEIIQQAKKIFQARKEEMKDQVEADLKAKELFTPRNKLQQPTQFTFKEPSKDETQEKTSLPKQPSQQKYEVTDIEYYQVAGEIILPEILKSVAFKKCVLAILESIKPSLSKIFYEQIQAQIIYFYPQLLPEEKEAKELKRPEFTRPAETALHSLTKRENPIAFLKELEVFLSRKILKRTLSENPTHDLFISPHTEFYNQKISIDSGSLARPESKAATRLVTESNTRQDLPSARGPSKNRRSTPTRPTTPQIPNHPVPGLQLNEIPSARGVGSKTLAVPESSRERKNSDEAPIHYKFTPYFEPKKYPALPTRANTIGWRGIIYFPDAVGELIYLMGVGICVGGNAVRNFIITPMKKLAAWLGERENTAGKVFGWIFLGLPTLIATAAVAIVPETIKWSLAIPLFLIKSITFTVAKITSLIGRCFSFCFSKNKSAKCHPEIEMTPVAKTPAATPESKAHVLKSSHSHVMRTIQVAEKKKENEKTDAPNNAPAIFADRAAARVFATRRSSSHRAVPIAPLILPAQTAPTSHHQEMLSEQQKKRAKRKTPFQPGLPTIIGGGSIDLSLPGQNLVPNSVAELGILATALPQTVNPTSPAADPPIDVRLEKTFSSDRTFSGEEEKTEDRTPRHLTLRLSSGHAN